jgi:hypothetical protein
MQYFETSTPLRNYDKERKKEHNIINSLGGFIRFIGK